MDEKPLVFIVSENGSDSNWLGTTRSLGKEGIPVVRLSPRGWYSSKYCSTLISPKISEEPQKFLEMLIRLGKKFARRGEHKPILMPSSDNALILISKNIDVLKDYFKPVASDWDCTEKIVDKSKTYNSAKELGIPVPETFLLEDTSEINKIANTVQYPCLIKPAHSHIFSEKFKTKLLQVFSQKILIKACKPLLAQGLKLLIQEKIPGGDDQMYSFGTCFNENSEPLAVCIQRKLRQYPPHFGIGSFKESVWEPKIVDMGIRLLKGIGFFGLGSVEFKRDQRTGEFILIEINGRSNTSMYLATKCGLNMHHILYKDLVGEKREPIYDYSCKYELGVKWVHLSIDFLSMMKKREEGEITLSKWLNSLLVGKKTFGIWSMDDPSPFFSEIKEAFHQVENLGFLLGNRHIPKKSY